MTGPPLRPYISEYYIGIFKELQKVEQKSIRANHQTWLACVLSRALTSTLIPF